MNLSADNIRLVFGTYDAEVKRLSNYIKATVIDSENWFDLCIENGGKVVYIMDEKTGYRIGFFVYRIKNDGQEFHCSAIVRNPKFKRSPIYPSVSKLLEKHAKNLGCKYAIIQTDKEGILKYFIKKQGFSMDHITLVKEL